MSGYCPLWNTRRMRLLSSPTTAASRARASTVSAVVAGAWYCVLEDASPAPRLSWISQWLPYQALRRLAVEWQHWSEMSGQAHLGRLTCKLGTRGPSNAVWAEAPHQALPVFPTHHAVAQLRALMLRYKADVILQESRRNRSMHLVKLDLWGCLQLQRPPIVEVCTWQEFFQDRFTKRCCRPWGASPWLPGTHQSAGAGRHHASSR